MDKARIYIDFNEMVTDDIVLLSKDDVEVDSQGNIVTFYEEMPVSIYSDDASLTGEQDHLLAEGVAMKYDLSNYPNWRHVKWCVRIDWNSLMHESDIKFLRVLPEEIKKHPHDLPALRECLISFKDHGMSRKSMLENLERLRSESNSETADIILELMDIAAGWCNPGLSIFD